jgi:MoaA/NifB/PqqE/SkfB family radical SAM enzyme
LYKRLYEGWNYRLRTVAGGRWASHCRPTSIVFLLTELCNARCVHCDIWKNRGKEDSPTPEQWKTVMTGLRRWLGPVQVTISGGEALLKPYTPDLVAHASSLGLFLEILTHGYWDDQSKIERLALARPWKVTISLDGIGETHSKIRGRDKFWEKTSTTIETLKRMRREKGLPYTIRLKNVIMSHNLQDTLEVARLATQDGMEVFYQAIEQNYNTAEDPQWYLHSENWPKDTARAAANVRELLAMKKRGFHIANSDSQLLAMIPYFENPEAHRVAIMSHSAHEAKRSCTALLHMQFQANGDVTVCTGVPPVGNVKQAPIREIWERRPHFWESGCCLERRCTEPELQTIVPSESLTAASTWKK